MIQALTINQTNDIYPIIKQISIFFKLFPFKIIFSLKDRTLVWAKTAVLPINRKNEHIFHAFFFLNDSFFPSSLISSIICPLSRRTLY